MEKEQKKGEERKNFGREGIQTLDAQLINCCE
jgi:hypothetical protein